MKNFIITNSNNYLKTNTDHDYEFALQLQTSLQFHDQDQDQDQEQDQKKDYKLEMLKILEREHKKQEKETEKEMQKKMDHEIATALQFGLSESEISKIFNNNNNNFIYKNNKWYKLQIKDCGAEGNCCPLSLVDQIKTNIDEHKSTELKNFTITQIRNLTSAKLREMRSSMDEVFYGHIFTMINDAKDSFINEGLTRKDKIDRYIQRVGEDRFWFDALCLEAFAEAVKVRIEVYAAGEQTNTSKAGQEEWPGPLNLFFIGGNHYQSIKKMEILPAKDVPQDKVSKLDESRKKEANEKKVEPKFTNWLQKFNEIPPPPPTPTPTPLSRDGLPTEFVYMAEKWHKITLDNGVPLTDFVKFLIEQIEKLKLMENSDFEEGFNNSKETGEEKEKEYIRSIISYVLKEKKQEEDQFFFGAISDILKKLISSDEEFKNEVDGKSWGEQIDIYLDYITKSSFNFDYLCLQTFCDTFNVKIDVFQQNSKLIPITQRKYEPDSEETTAAKGPFSLFFDDSGRYWKIRNLEAEASPFLFSYDLTQSQEAQLKREKILLNAKFVADSLNGFPTEKKEAILKIDKTIGKIKKFGIPSKAICQVLKSLIRDDVEKFHRFEFIALEYILTELEAWRNEEEEEKEKEKVENSCVLSTIHYPNKILVEIWLLDYVDKNEIFPKLKEALDSSLDDEILKEKKDVELSIEELQKLAAKLEEQIIIYNNDDHKTTIYGTEQENKEPIRLFVLEESSEKKKVRIPFRSKNSVNTWTIPLKSKKAPTSTSSSQEIPKQKEKEDHPHPHNDYDYDYDYDSSLTETSTSTSLPVVVKEKIVFNEDNKEGGKFLYADQWSHKGMCLYIFCTL
jgi:hypothetical protein